MWVYDVATLRFLDVNDAALLKYGYTRDEFLALRVTDIRPRRDTERVRQSIRKRRGNQLTTSGPWRHLLHDGREIEVEVTSQPLTFAGRPSVLVSARDISVDRALEERLRHFSLHDPLTGLGNRRKLTLELDDVLQRSTEGGGRALLVIDIEGLKTVNTELGRQGGDEVLVAFVDRFATACGDQARLYRIDGQAFGAIVDADLRVARGHAAALLSALIPPFSVGGQEAFVSAHIGVARSEPGWRADDLLRTADAALQSVSDLRGPRIAVFNGDHDVLRHVLRSQGFAPAGELRRALKEEQLRVFYQPLLDLRRGEISGVEALVRWEHPLRGLITPYEFIPIAERAGIVAEIDVWVLATACRQMRAWREAGLPAMTMSVNLSGHDLDSGPQLVAQIRAELERNAIDPSLLEVELTESTALHNQEEVERILDELRALGVGVALDDFGTGYSMLDRIRDLPVDRIKIDRTFIRRVTAGGGPLVTAVITMAHSLHLGVVAEGVETDAQLTVLRAQGCDFAQGYLIGRPAPASAISAQLRSVTRFPDSSVHHRISRSRAQV